MASSSKNARSASIAGSDADVPFSRESETLGGGSAEDQRLAALKARLGDLGGLRVLEPGCGSGGLTEWLSAWVGERGFVEAFDSSPSELAKRRQALAGRVNVRFLQRRCEDADYAAASFDRIVCFRSFPRFEDVDGAIECFSRWLKPHGRLHIVQWESRSAHAAQQTAGADKFIGYLPPREVLASCFGRRSLAILREIDNREEVYIELERI